MKAVQEKRFFVILFIGLMGLIFLQLLSDFIEAIYASCLLTLEINGNLFAFLLLLSPALLILFGQRTSPLFLIFVGELAILFRLAEISSSPTYKIIFSGLGLACFMLYLPTYLHFIKDSNRNTKGASFGFGLTLAVLIWIALKTLNSSVDLSGYGSMVWVSWVIAVLAFLLLPMVILGGENTSKSRNRQIFGKKSERPSVFLPALGLMSVITLIYFVFSSPAIVTRWINGDYVWIVTFEVAVLFSFAILNLLNPNPEVSLPKPILVLGNTVFVLLLVVLVFNLQSNFPSNESEYPIFMGKVQWADHLLLYLILFLVPILFVNISVFAGQMIKTSVSIARVGFGFLTVNIIFILFALIHIYTSVYDYIPVIGTLFRDKYWLVHLLVGLGIIFPIAFSRHELIKNRSIRFSKRDRLGLSIVFAGVSAVIIFNIPRISPTPPAMKKPASIKVMTYNIQQGYNKNGEKDYSGQLNLIKELNPDIIGLQETDSLRIAGGNNDIVRYYADRLNMYSINGPSPVTGTFGIALLSKFPIQNSQTFFMYSKGEQTATIEAQLKTGDKTITVYVTHLGNEGDMVQQKTILNQLQGKPNVVLMGDFNFDRQSPQYQATTQLLTDSWLAARSSDGSTKQELTTEDQQQVDHIFSSSDLVSFNSQYINSDHSDHPALIVDFTLQ